MKINLKLLGVSIIAGIIGCALLSDKPDDVKMQQELSEKLLRFHVVANSDSEEDQTLKLKVKEAVVNYLETYLNDTMTLEETENVITEHNDEVINLARKIVLENGYDYNVSARLTSCYFPVKSYGDVTLPAGDYEAYRITIGEAEGKNWWCILYPPLCFVDVSYGYVPDESKVLLENILDDEEYSYITGGYETIYRFKYLTFLNGLFE